MARTEIAFRFAFPAAHIWTFADWLGPERLVGFGGPLSRVNFEPRRAVVGSIRIFEYDGGARVLRERLESLNEAGRHYVYRLTDTGDLPLTDYVGEVRVTPAGDQQCCLKLGCEFTPVECSARQCIRLYHESERAIAATILRAAEATADS